jgi:hypothetical protein
MDGDSARERYRQAIATRAQERRSELLEVIFHNILDELPEYANGRSAAELEDIRVGVQHSIDLCLSILGPGGRLLHPEERSLLRCTGGQRARQGIPKPVVLASVKIAVRVGRAFLMTCNDVGEDAAALVAAFRDITEILDRFEDEACSSLAEGHDEAWGQVLSAADRGEAVLVDRLLEQRFEDGEEVLAHAADVGLSRLRAAHVAVVTSVGVLDEKRLRAAVAELRVLAMLAVGPLRVTHRVHLPFVVQPRDPEEWQRFVERLPQVAAKHGTTVVWAERPTALTDLAPVYASLRDGLPFLAAGSSRAGAQRALITRFFRVVCSGTPEERAELFEEIVRPLAGLAPRERNELLEALDALYETGGTSAALARHLHLHKNTVAGRLRRVHEVLGLDVRRPVERLVLEIALRMRHVADGGACLRN